MKIAAISVGMLIALICAFLLGGFFLGGRMGNAKLPRLSISLSEPDQSVTDKPVQPAVVAPAQPAAVAPVQPAPPVQPSPPKPKFPHMELQAQYAGPFEDTLIQRWRDPIDHRVCYIYLPMNVKHAPVEQDGILDYGSNAIGSISCGAPGPDVVVRKPHEVPLPLPK